MIMKRLILAVFSVFFVTAVMAQEVPRAKPAEKSAPVCNTISKFFGHVEYVARSHRNFIDLRFAFVPKDKVIVVFHIVGPCIQGKGIIIRKDHPYFAELYQLIFAGWDA